MNPPVNLTKPPPPPWAGATADDLDRYQDDFLADCPVCSRSPFDDACLHVWCEIPRLRRRRHQPHGVPLRLHRPRRIR
jgi:hypothetical protein